jgi:hypothetical protein
VKQKKQFASPLRSVRIDPSSEFSKVIQEGLLRFPLLGALSDKYESLPKTFVRIGEAFIL